MGDHLRRKRLESRLIQAEVAGLLGVDDMTINNWETNRTVPAVRLIPRIIHFLGYVPFDPSILLSDKLALCRRLLGLSQKEFSKLIKVNESSVRKWEHGEKPSRRYMKILAELLCSDVRLT